MAELVKEGYDKMTALIIAGIDGAGSLVGGIGLGAGRMAVGAAMNAASGDGVGSSSSAGGTEMVSAASPSAAQGNSPERGQTTVIQLQHPTQFIQAAVDSISAALPEAAREAVAALMPPGLASHLRETVADASQAQVGYDLESPTQGFARSQTQQRGAGAGAGAMA
jgi:hypothetical protein